MDIINSIKEIKKFPNPIGKILESWKGKINLKLNVSYNSHWSNRNNL